MQRRCEAALRLWARLHKVVPTFFRKPTKVVEDAQQDESQGRKKSDQRPEKQRRTAALLLAPGARADRCHWRPRFHHGGFSRGGRSREKQGRGSPHLVVARVRQDAGVNARVSGAQRGDAQLEGLAGLFAQLKLIPVHVPVPDTLAVGALSYVFHSVRLENDAEPEDGVAGEVGAVALDGLALVQFGIKNLDAVLLKYLS